MNRPLSIFLLVLGAAVSAAAGQESPPNLASVGIKALAYEDPDDIFLIDAQAAKPRKLIGNASHPAWSHDGSQIAYCTRKGVGFGQIEIANADGSGTRQITNIKGGACFPDWSPDGTKIAFTALRIGASEKNLLDATMSGSTDMQVFVVDINRGNPIPVAPGYSPQWSPRGSMLVFLRSGEKNEPRGSVWIATADGKQTKLIAISNFVMRGASWLPSGRGIMASYRQDGDYAIFAAYLDGSQPEGTAPQRLGGERHTDWAEPVLSPDGKHLIAVERCSDCRRDKIVLLDEDTKKSVPLAEGTNYSVLWDKR